MVKSALIALLVQSVQAGAPMLAPDETLLQVQAQGEARYVPDTAYITMGVVSTGTTAREATDANARQMSEVIAAILKAGVGDRFIRSQQISVEPRFARADPTDYQGQARITGYVARNSVAVTVGKLASAPDVIAAGFAAGANSVSGPNLAAADPEAGVAEARAAAVANATAEANAYAKAFGLRVTRILRIGERGNAAQPDLYVTASRVAAPAPPPPPPPVAAGEMRRTLTLWVDYALAK